MNKTRYSATEFGLNKPMNFRPSGTLKLKCRITQKNSVKFLPAPAAFFGGVFLHTVEWCSLTLERMVFLHA